MSHQETLRKGPWLEEEDQQLVSFVSLFGERRWDLIASAAGLRRSGKSCRLRWLNYLRPNLKRGHISQEEEQVIIQLHQLWGNKWAKIARRLPGRTDNEIKNYWRTHLKKKLQPQQGKNSKEEPFGGLENKNNRWKFSSEDSKCESNEEMNMGSNKGQNYYELSSLENLMNSPYENMLYDNWISSSVDHQDEIMRSNDDLKACNCFEYCLCSCSFSFNGEDGDNDASILDSMGSLWDLT